MYFRNSSKQIFIITIAILLFTNCSLFRKSKQLIIQNDVNDRFQTIWVDPQIITSDSLITLIRAGRIDSLEVSLDEQMKVKSTSVEIPISNSPCNVSVNLIDSNMTFIHPLLVRTLQPGYYRLTFNTNRLKLPKLTPGRYLLKAEFCGNTRLAYFTVKDSSSIPTVQ